MLIVNQLDHAILVPQRAILEKITEAKSQDGHTSDLRRALARN